MNEPPAISRRDLLKGAAAATGAAIAEGDEPPEPAMRSPQRVRTRATDAPALPPLAGCRREQFFLFRTQILTERHRFSGQIIGKSVFILQICVPFILSPTNCW